MARSAGWRSSLLLAPAVPPPKRTGGEIGQPKFARRFLGTFYVKIANPDVHLSASPLEEYIEAFQRAIENAQLLLEELFAEPTPISEDWVLNSLVTGLLDDQDANRREFAAAALGETPPR